MTNTFPRRTRSLLLLVSAACYLASFADVGEPLDARDLAAAKSVAAPDSPSTSFAVGALVRRDPFLRESTGASLEHVSLPPDDGPPVPNIDPHSDAIGRDAATSAAPPPEPFVVRATIVGRRPVAFVVKADRESIVGVGDSLGGVRVRAIDLQGVVLADGTRLDLPSSYLATPRPRYHGESRADAALDAVANLRTLLLRGHFDREPTARARVATPVQAPPPEPSPAPLRTVDPRGLAPGVNPTPDVLDATAQPYPYPYAPVPH